MDGATPLFTPASHDRSFKLLIAFLQIHRVEPLLFQAVSAGVSGCYSGNKSCCSIWLFVSCPDLTSFEAATVRLRPPRRFLEIVKGVTSCRSPNGHAPGSRSSLSLYSNTNPIEEIWVPNRNHALYIRKINPR